MKYIYRCLVYLYLALSVALAAALLCLGFPEFLSFVLQVLGMDVRQEVIVSFHSRIPVLLIYFILVLNICIAILAVYKQMYFQNKIERAFFYCKQAFINLFRSFTFPEIVVVIAVPLLASLYFAATVPVSYDEAVTYNYFTVKPFYFSMIFYPYPNNHVLHSLLTNISECIPFLPPLFSIRVPAIIASIFTWLIGYSFLKKYYPLQVALLVVGAMSAMYMSVYYSFMSRGYSFTVLSFVVCMYAAFNIITQGSRNKDWMFFATAGVLGCYSIPSFLYPFVTLNVLILIYNYKNIKQQFVSNIIAGGLVVLLYSPIMIVDGIAALTSNQFVQPIERLFIVKNIFFFCRAMIASIVGVPLGVVALMAIPLLYTIYRKDKKLLLLWCVFMLAPFVLLLIHAVNPFYRTFIYYNFIIAFLMIVPFKELLDRVPKYAVLLVVVCLQTAGVYSFNDKIGVDEGFNTDAAKVADTYFKQGKRICFPCIASENYKFEAKVRGLEDQIDFQENEKADVDTIGGYDYIILEKRRDQTVHKKPYATSDAQNIYSR